MIRLTAVILALAALCLSPAHAAPLTSPRLVTAPGSPAFVFGVHAGFNNPARIVTVYAGGRVSNGHAPLSHRKLQHLLNLAVRAGFFHLPHLIPSPHRMTDTSTSFISIHLVSGPYTVNKQPGGANGTFTRVMMALQRAAGGSR